MFFYVFFQNPKKHDFLRFFEWLTTFSRTLLYTVHSHKVGAMLLYVKHVRLPRKVKAAASRDANLSQEKLRKQQLPRGRTFGRHVSSS